MSTIQQTFFEWMKSNLGPVITIVTILIGVVASEINQINRIDALEKFQASHILFHGERGKEVEGKIATIEQKITPIDNMSYRLSRVEISVDQSSQNVSKQMDAIGSKVDKMSSVFLEASVKMGDRLTRIETLLEGSPHPAPSRR